MIYTFVAYNRFGKINFFQIGCFMYGSTYINFVVFKHLLHITPALVVADVFHSRFVFRFHPAYGIRPSQRSSRVWFHAVKWLRWHRSIVDTVRSHRWMLIVWQDIFGSLISYNIPISIMIFIYPFIKIVYLFVYIVNKYWLYREFVVYYKILFYIIWTKKSMGVYYYCIY